MICDDGSWLDAGPRLARPGKRQNIGLGGGVGRQSRDRHERCYRGHVTESLSQELSGTGVTATALCPGLTDTAMVRSSQIAKVVPAPMIMSPKDVAELGCSACLKGETNLRLGTPIYVWQMKQF